MYSGRLINELTEIEDCAEEVIADKHHITEQDRKRHKLREAISALKKDEGVHKTWTCFNNLFIKMPTSSTVALLEKDYRHISSDIQEKRDTLKNKVDRLRDLKHEARLQGYDLEPLSSQDLRVVDPGR